MADVVRELEAAAEILLAPPNVINSEQRHCAEAVFLNFQKSKSPFQLCQFILANTKVDFVQFQAATLFKVGIIREWKILPKSDIEQLRTGLLNFVIQNPGLQSYVREQLLLVVAVMVKRASVEDKSEIVNEFLNEVSQLIGSGDSAMQTIGCSILTALLNEFASSTKATDVGLAWEDHLAAKRKFEKTDLKRLFQFCLQGLSELYKVGTPISPETAKLFKKFLMIAEQVLTWNFQFSLYLPKKLVGMFESQQSPPIRPSVEWREVFLDPNVIQLFFKLHWQVRDNPDLCHHTLQCFHQLASLNGVIMNKREDKCLYLSWFLENLLQLLTSGPLKDYETVCISNMICRLHMFFPAAYMTSLPPNVIQTYLVELTKMACLFCERAALEELGQQDDKIYMEAFEHILQAWFSVFQNSSHFPEEILKQSALQIFNQYLKSHLSPPDGSRVVNLNVKEEIDEIEEDDRTKYASQLSIIGAFGRSILEHTIPLLVRLLEDRVTRLHGQLQRIHQLGSANDTTLLEFLNEDIHWLVMIAGHILSHLSEGETTLIPITVIRYSMTQIENINMETTLNVLVSPSHRVCDIPNAEVSTDPVVRLIAAVFRLCEVEKRALEAQLFHLMSPEVALTCVWFLGRFAITYLLPNETYYSEMSLTLTQAFGKDTEAGLWTLDYVIGKFESNLTLWQSESKVLIESTKNLSAVVNNTERGEKAMNCASLVSLVKKQSAGMFQNLPTTAKRFLLKSLVIVGTANKQEGVKDCYWQELLKPLQDKFRTVVCNPNFTQTYQNKQVQMEVLDLIECLSGVVDGCTFSNISHLMNVINPIFDDIVKLADLYHNYSMIVGAIFQVFCVASKRIVCYDDVDEGNAKKLYESCINVIRIYAKHNAGKTSREAGNEEEQYQDILTLMKLLTDLMFKDFLSYASSTGISLWSGKEPCTTPYVGVSVDGVREEPTTAGDVVLFGLGVIMSIINRELLNFPSLCLQYYKLITLVCDIHPTKIVTLPENIFKPLISSVELGLSAYTTEVTALCLDFLCTLGSHLYRSENPPASALAALEPFLKIVLDLVIQQPLDAHLTQCASTALHTLICCYQAQFKVLVDELINSQSDPATAQRLLASFNKLSKGLSLTLDRFNRMKFKESFEEFVTDVGGYLCVK